MAWGVFSMVERMPHDLTGILVSPCQLLDIDVILIVKEAESEVQRVVDLRASDMEMDSGIRVHGEVGHRDELAWAVRWLAAEGTVDDVSDATDDEERSRRTHPAKNPLNMSGLFGWSLKSRS